MEAEFILSAVSERDFPRDGAPEIVLAGRSNVGKSSLINKLVEKKGLARTSSTPGKTQNINFYRLNQSFYVVDLPGYGYAKASKSASREWRRLVEEYFHDRAAIALVVELVDARIPPTALDIGLADWLDHSGIPWMIVATKADKLSGNRKGVQQRVISNAFGGRPVTFSSAVTGTGCKEIWHQVVEAVRSNYPREKSARV